MDETRIRLRDEADSFKPAGPDLADVRRRTARRAARRKRAALAVGALGTAATIGGLAFALVLSSSPSVSIAPQSPTQDSSSPSADVSSPPDIFFAPRQPFVPRGNERQITLTFPNGTNTVLILPHLNALSAVTPFATLYPEDGCGGSVLFGWRGVTDGVVDPSSGVELPSSGGAFLFEGMDDWQPYYLGLTSGDWTILIPCPSRNKDRVQAAASRLAQDLTVSVNEGLPTLYGKSFAQLGSWQDGGGAPSLQFVFELNTYLELSPRPRCSGSPPSESAGVTQWCVSGAKLALHARAEGDPAIVRDIVNELTFGTTA